MFNTPGRSNWLTSWLINDTRPLNFGLCDFSRLSKEVQFCDVLLLEGRSRISDVIKLLSQSPWSHSVLYIGTLESIRDIKLRNFANEFVSPADRHKPLILEALFDEGVTLTPLEKYRGEHIRICRAHGLCPEDADIVVADALKNLGKQYNSRHIFDLLRYLLPIKILPKRWLSSLFNPKYGKLHEEICSTLLANAFAKINFPIRPIIDYSNKKKIKLYRRNTKLFTPSDFDYSPYFEIIKYPIYSDGDQPYYRHLEWDTQGRVLDSEKDLLQPKE